MKRALTPLILILAVLACGCTASAPSSQTTVVATPPAAAAIPNLTGTWTGTTLGYQEGAGFTDYNNIRMSMVVTGQQGRVFAGYLKFGPNSTGTIAMAGIIGRDGQTFSLVEDDNGYTTGEIISADMIELIHVDDADPYGIALDTLTRARV